MGNSKQGKPLFSHKNISVIPKCLKSTSNVLKDLPEAKICESSQKRAKIQRLRFSIISIAHANSLKLFYGIHLFFLCRPIFKIVVAHFTTNSGQSIDKKTIVFFFH